MKSSSTFLDLPFRLCFSISLPSHKSLRTFIALSSWSLSVQFSRASCSPSLSSPSLFKDPGFSTGTSQVLYYRTELSSTETFVLSSIWLWVASILLKGKRSLSMCNVCSAHNLSESVSVRRLVPSPPHPSLPSINKSPPTQVFSPQSSTFLVGSLRQPLH